MSIAFEGPVTSQVVEGRRQVAATFSVGVPIVFKALFRIRIEGPAGPVAAHSGDQNYIGWLPRGRYRVEAFVPDSLPAGAWNVVLEAVHNVGLQPVLANTVENRVTLGAPVGGAQSVTWKIEGVAPTARLAELSWTKPHSDWFFRHFDHAALTIITYLLADSPKLRGRILDVGCGDGITDLSIALRTQCEELVGVDPFRGYERLPEVLAANGMPADLMPKNLRYLPEDANHLPFEDNHFDVVISWGSVEHIAGGYLKALDEMRRVLKPGGLLFIHPGLFYSNVGSHLGEFSDEPFFHLKKSREELQRLVLNTKPNYMDRAGEFSTPEQYWQWFTELNPITVDRFERELRERDLQPWRVALRTEGLIEYTPEIEHFPMQDLATGELYVSCVNRKPA